MTNHLAAYHFRARHFEPIARAVVFDGAFDLEEEVNLAYDIGREVLMTPAYQFHIRISQTGRPQLDPEL